MHNSGNLRTSRIAMESLADSLGSELIEAESVMTDVEIHRMVEKLRDVNAYLDNTLFQVLEYLERPR